MSNDRFVRLFYKDLLDMEDDEDEKFFLFNVKKVNKRYVNAAQKEYNRRKYRDELKRVVFSENYKDLFNKSVQTKNDDWPHRARKQPSIGAPLNIVDMPGLTNYPGYHTIDWSKRGILAGIFGNEIFAWEENMSSSYCMSFTGKQVKFNIKWNKEGTEIAASKKQGGGLVWNVETNSITQEFKCCSSTRCVITALEWRNDGILVTGCSNGFLAVLCNAKILKSVPTFHNEITHLKFSSDGNYLSTAGIDVNIIIWTWPDLQMLFCIAQGSLVTNIAWHPWKTLLCVAGTNGSVRIWNVKVKQETGFYRLAKLSCDSMAWNELTGELVLSLFPKRTKSSTNSFVVVMSNFQTQVDMIQWHSGRVKYLLWGDGGTKLATGCTAGHICIWNFLGSKRKESQSSYPIAKRSSLLSYCVR